MTGSSRPLKQALLNAYGHFSDKRIKNIDRGSQYIVDDRHPGDHGADRNLYLWFCSVFAEVVDPSTVNVSLRGGVPHGAPVIAWAKQHGVTIEDEAIIFTVTPGDLSKLGQLAQAFRAIVAPGAPRYNVAAYKFVCPRTAATLTRLEKVLANHWK